MQTKRKRRTSSNSFIAQAWIAERNTGILHRDSKFQVEEYIRAIKLPYTILRPVFFFYNYNMMRPMVETGTLPQPLSPDQKLQQLSEEDYGVIAA